MLDIKSFTILLFFLLSISLLTFLINTLKFFDQLIQSPFDLMEETLPSDKTFAEIQRHLGHSRGARDFKKMFSEICTYQVSIEGDLEFLGKGSFAKVYKLNNLAIRKIDLSSEKIVFSEFVVSEAISASDLPAHPNLLKYYGCHYEKDVVSLVYEYFDGFELLNIPTKAKLKLQGFKTRDERKEFLSQYRCNPSHFLIVNQLAAALQHIHSNGFIHGDVKLENILINFKGELKLIDYSYLMPVKRARMLKKRIGSKTYQSPEMFNSRKINFGTDVWALGEAVQALVVMGGKVMNMYIHNEERGLGDKLDKIYEKLIKESLENEYSAFISEDLPVEWKEIVQKCICAEKKRGKMIEIAKILSLYEKDGDLLKQYLKWTEELKRDEEPTPSMGEVFPCATGMKIECKLS